jgi:hypothetical protein
MSRVLVTAFCLIAAGSAMAQPVYHTTPDWESADTQVGTGAALVDLDRDGWLDFVVANGNDMAQQHLAVYYNQGDGTFPAVPDWQSSDYAYNGHLDVADVNGDGWMDVAVAYLGEFSTYGPIARLYQNNAGVLTSTPVWESDIDGNAFGVAFGDMNNDGRPDLAVATGWSYSPQHYYNNYVYLNVDGELEETASWVSDDQNHYQGVLWVDGDNDGWQDLVGAAGRTYSSLYRNLGGMLETTASWQTADNVDQDAIMATAGDVTGDGVVDLFITDNTQLGGSGRIRQYTGLSDGLFDDEYSWSYYEGYGSAVALADVNTDGMLDLATGSWWGNGHLFYNTGSGLPASPSWTSSVSSVIEKIVFGDVDPACGIELVFSEHFAPDGDRTLFHLPVQPIQGLVSVVRDGAELAPDEYTWSRERGWISLDAPPAVGLVVTYRHSHSMDMAISNWDSSVGNYLYYNQRFDDCNDNGVPDGCDIYNGTSQDNNGNGIPDECECPADFDGDGDVDTADLLFLLGAWGTPDGDVDGDGDTDTADLLALLAAWGEC